MSSQHNNNTKRIVQGFTEYQYFKFSPVEFFCLISHMASKNLEGPNTITSHVLDFRIIIATLYPDTPIQGQTGAAHFFQDLLYAGHKKRTCSVDLMRSGQKGNLSVPPNLACHLWQKALIGSVPYLNLT